jgi:hypothetical protein
MQQQLEDTFRNFEEKGGWRLSLPAKVVIQQGLISLTTDTLGMGDIATVEARYAAVQKALETLPDFLEHLARKASERQESNTNVIGAIFVLQHVEVWAVQMFKCSCWPT